MKDTELLEAARFALKVLKAPSCNAPLFSQRIAIAKLETAIAKATIPQSEEIDTVPSAADMAVRFVTLGKAAQVVLSQYFDPDVESTADTMDEAMHNLRKAAETK